MAYEADRYARASFDSAASESIFDVATPTITAASSSWTPDSPDSLCDPEIWTPLPTPALYIPPVQTTYTQLREVPLYALPSGEHIRRAGELWQDSAVVVYVVRRAGCPLCRAQARLVSECGPFFERLGYKLVAVINDENDKDMVGFAKTNWAGKLVLDVELGFHLAVGEGAIRIGKKTEPLSVGFTKRIYRAMVTNRVMGTPKSGNGPYMGGVMVIMQGDGGIVHTQAENVLGDFGDFARVLQAAYVYGPNRKSVKADELNDEIAAHRKRVKGRLQKQCGCEGLDDFTEE